MSKQKPAIHLPKFFFTSSFVHDSMERGVFEADNGTASIEQLKALLSDADYYSDQHGPDMIPKGLKASAKKTAEQVRALLISAGEAA